MKRTFKALQINFSFISRYICCFLSFHSPAILVKVRAVSMWTLTSPCVNYVIVLLKTVLRFHSTFAMFLTIFPVMRVPCDRACN